MRYIRPASFHTWHKQETLHRERYFLFSPGSWLAEEKRETRRKFVRSRARDSISFPRASLGRLFSLLDDLFFFSFSFFATLWFLFLCLVYFFSFLQIPWKKTRGKSSDAKRFYESRKIGLRIQARNYGTFVAYRVDSVSEKQTKTRAFFMSRSND